MSTPLLYHSARSSCSWRVRIALTHKNIEFESKIVNTGKNETRTPEYMAINPGGQVPCFEINGHRMGESMAIMEFLEEIYPDKPLLPQTPKDRSKVREMCEIIVSGIQPLQNPKVAGKLSDNPKEQLEWTNFYVQRGFKALETLLNANGSNGKFCFGNSLTLVDCCLVPQVYNAVERFHLDLSDFPKITSIYKALMELEEVKQTHPDKY